MMNEAMNDELSKLMVTVATQLVSDIGSWFGGVVEVGEEMR